jgi:hypothetical protein
MAEAHQGSSSRDIDGDPAPAPGLGETDMATLPGIREGPETASFVGTWMGMGMAWLLVGAAATAVEKKAAAGAACCAGAMTWPSKLSLPGPIGGKGRARQTPSAGSRAERSASTNNGHKRSRSCGGSGRADYGRVFQFGSLK